MRAVVEVDSLIIRNGPGATKWLDVALFLLDNYDVKGNRPFLGVDVTFTVTTDASPLHFKACVTVRCISKKASGSDEYFYFSGKLQGKLVEGTYNLQTHVGRIDEL